MSGKSPDESIQDAIDQIKASGKKSQELGRAIIACRHAQGLILAHDAPVKVNTPAMTI